MIRLFLATAIATLRLTAIDDNFDGIAGVAAINLDNGQRITYHANDPFPMASVYKVPIAVAFLQRVDRGEVSLDEKVTLGLEDFHAGNSPIVDEANGQPITLPLRRLFMHMVRDSDNSAVDYILAHYVSPKEVMKALHGIKVSNVDVSRPEAMIIGEILNEGDKIATRKHYSERLQAMSPAERGEGIVKFWNDPRDTATPLGIAELFVKIHKHQAGLSADSEKLLLEALATSGSGPDRLRAGVPEGSTVAHKTGTMPGSINDAGIITSPDGKHHIAIAVFTKHSRGPEKDGAKVVAAIAKTVWEQLTQ